MLIFVKKKKVTVKIQLIVISKRLYGFLKERIFLFKKGIDIILRVTFKIKSAFFYYT